MWIWRRAFGRIIRCRTIQAIANAALADPDERVCSPLSAASGSTVNRAGATCCGRCCCRRFTASARGAPAYGAGWSSIFCSRWFVGLGVDDPVWDHSSFSKNRDRLLEGEIAAKFLAAVLAQPKVKRLLSSDHFSVDGTLIEAWASIKSFRKKDGGDDDRQGPGRNAERNFHQEKRSNETHRSVTDPRGTSLPRRALASRPSFATWAMP